MDRSPLLRALVAGRLLGVAGAVLGLGSGAHVLAGGALPSAAALLLLAVPVLVGAAALARRPLSVRLLLPVALAGQLGVHAGLTWLSAGGAAAGGAHLHGPGAPAVAEVAEVAGAAGVAGHAHAASVPMLAAHAAALVAAVLLLVGTERGIAGLVRRWSAMLPALLGRGPRPTTGARGPVAALVRDVRPLPAGRGGVGRRGPPGVPHLATAA